MQRKNKNITVKTLPSGYKKLLSGLKDRIRKSQTHAVISANKELIMLYWEIGKAIVERQETEKWGNSVVESLAADLQRTFPSMSGFSTRNIWRMRMFFLTWRKRGEVVSVRTSSKRKLPQAVAELSALKLPQAVAVLPWGHNIVLIEKINSYPERLWYAKQAVIHGWSRTILLLHIENNLYKRKGRAITNFKRTLPPIQSEIVQQTLKDPYVFDFLTLTQKTTEVEIEQSMMNHIQRVLLELGKGFAFVGRQVHLDVAGEDFYIDLLFYHLSLRRYIVIELKTGQFKPEYAGKMNFYLSAVDEQFRHKDDLPTIGLLLCKEKKKLIVEYALRDTHKPIGVADWVTVLKKTLPKSLQKSLPTAKELQ